MAQALLPPAPSVKSKAVRRGGGGDSNLDMLNAHGVVLF